MSIRMKSTLRSVRSESFSMSSTDPAGRGSRLPRWSSTKVERYATTTSATAPSQGQRLLRIRFDMRVEP